MGTVFPRQSDNMKLFAVLALASVAFAEPEAEADPALLYGTYGYGVPAYGAYGAYGAYNAYRPYSYGGYYYGKRSAEAEPEAEADPALLYNAYGYGLPYAGAYGAYGAYGYGHRTYGAYPYASAYYGKRSADAEPKAEADPALLYNAYGYGLPSDHCLHRRCCSPDHCLHPRRGRSPGLHTRHCPCGHHCCQDCRPHRRPVHRPLRLLRCLWLPHCCGWCCLRQ